MSVSYLPGTSLLSNAGPASDFLTPYHEPKNTPVKRRSRREADDVTPAVVIPDKDVPAAFMEKLDAASAGKGRDEFIKGYKSPTRAFLPGYDANMSDLALMRLALDQQLSPEQLGTLKRITETRLVGNSIENMHVFIKIVTDKGVKITPMSQGYYLSVISRLSNGECAGLIHLLSLAVAAGKQDVFLTNLVQAVADPDNPESKEFFRQVASAHAAIENSQDVQDAATTRVAPYTTIAPELSDSPVSKTLIVTNGGNGLIRHRLSVGVIVSPEGKRTYYYADPNVSYVEFSSIAALELGLKRIFTSPVLNKWYRPYSSDASGDYYKISVFDPALTPQVSAKSSNVKYTYNATLRELDRAKILDASHVPTSEVFRAQSPEPEAASADDYNLVRENLDKLHAAKGMTKFHYAVDTLAAVRSYLLYFPHSPIAVSMQALEKTLISAINNAAIPSQHPYAFERIEQKKADLAGDKLAGVLKSRTETVQATDVGIKSDIYSDPARSKSVVDAISSALLKIQQDDPRTAKAVGPRVEVIIAKPGDQPETILRFTTPPTLIIGDDFFAKIPAGDNTVADRLGREGKTNGGDPVAQKQAAIINGKLGMLGYYKADSQALLEVLDNKEPFRDGGDKVSARATRSPGDFMEEVYTARLYDGKVDSHTDAAFNRLFGPPEGASNAIPGPSVASPPSAPKAPVVRPSVIAGPVNQAEIERLRGLDSLRSPIRLGDKDVSRVELYQMGATLNGKPIEDPLPGDVGNQKLSNSMKIDYEQYRAHMSGKPDADVLRATTILFEITTHSTRDPSELFTRAGGEPIPAALLEPLRELPEQYKSIKALADSKKPLPANFFSPKAAGAINGAGLGLQAFSTFHALYGAIENIRNGDTKAGAIGLGGVGADYLGIGLDKVMSKVAQNVASSTAPKILGFKSSSLGSMIGKVGGAGSALITVPFDIYNAVDSFNKAAKSTGKEAQDHYVNGAFAIANATTSIALSAAFLAGFSSAGPVGLAIAAVLMTAQAIYSAVRTVEEINQYTPLSGTQKFTTGLAAFLGFEPSFSVLKPYLEAKYSQAYDKQKRENYEAFLKGEGKDHFERVVFGSVDVVVTQEPGKTGLTGQHWWSPITYLLNLIKVDGTVTSVKVNGGNDRINAPTDSWNGVKVKPVEGTLGEGRATLWDLGDGNDSVAGVFTKPNYFLLGGGKKLIQGGEVDDTVIFNADARQTLEQVEQVFDTEEKGFSKKASELWGGDGRNTLIFSGSLSTEYTEGEETRTADYLGHVINFKTGSVAVNTKDSKRDGVTNIAYFHEFSNAVTVENGESYIVGDDQSNLFTLNGKKDVVLTGKGSDVVVINGGATVVGEGGPNTYIINKGDKEVTITDPNDSVIKLDYSANQVSGWSVSPSGDLTVNLIGDRPGNDRKLVIKKAVSNEAKDDSLKAKFITNDGVMMAVTVPYLEGSNVRIPQVSSVKLVGNQPEA